MYGSFFRYDEPVFMSDSARRDSNQARLQSMANELNGHHVGGMMQVPHTPFSLSAFRLLSIQPTF